ncbi:ABC transporter [Lactococcus hodotermopsidis]|uniref:ABC transporter n=1 Tax=Pseudolactococcus hodotermopsidis TaxID=2709157 RepID=A0A6A0BGD3_9LACT|nr:ABC transporter permease [Lactococcus hodotermopsidis]GFH43418.1 ABC transporter [Lactococcus hodotermopsidis]
MIKLIKADLYRLVRSTGFYITLLAIALVNGGITYLLTSDFNEGANTSFHELVSEEQGGYTTIIIYFAVSLFVIIFGHEFSQLTYKNSLISGASKLEFILSKYVTILLAFMMLTYLCFFSTVVVAFVRFGAADMNLFVMIGNLLAVGFGVAVIVSIIFSLAMLLLIVTGSTVVAISFAILYHIVIVIVQLLLHWQFLTYLSFLDFGNLLDAPLTFNIAAPYVAITFVVISLSLVFSTIAIKKKEL